MARSLSRLTLDLARLLEQQTRLDHRKQLLLEKMQAARDREANRRSTRRLTRQRKIPSI